MKSKDYMGYLMFDNYLDMYGRVTLFPVGDKKVDKGEYTDKNPWLWTGQAALLSPLKTNPFTLQDDLLFLCLCRCKVGKSFGLFSRHPNKPFDYINSKHFDSISLDEHNGIAFMASTGCSKSNAALNTIITYGIKHKWCFYEKDPTGVIASPIKSILKLLRYAWNNKDFKGSKKMDQFIFKNPDLILLSRIRLYKDRAFLKMISNNYTSKLLEDLHFYASIIYTCNKDKLSGLNMLYFKFKALDNVGHNTTVYKVLKWYFDYKMKKKFKTKFYMQKIFKRFYSDENHPFHEMV